MAIFNQKGNTLLFAISGITMIAALAMGMFYMTSTSSLGQAGGSGMNRAYYLALAGKDYALANWNSGLPLTGEFILSNTERFSLLIIDFKITSTGIVNKDTPFEARKTIKASSPSPARKHFFESFEDKSKWDESTKLGTFDTPLVLGDKALQATGVTTPGFGAGTGSWSFLQLKTGTCVGCAVDFSPAWENAGYCLSHDLQVKIANIPLQQYYMAGLNFKVSGSGNSREFYGISYIRGKRKFNWGTFQWESDDGAPIELKPPPIFPTIIATISNPAIVLWKRQNGSFTWLAYKIISSSDFVVDGSNKLVDWSTLQVRLNEAYPLGFTNGGPSPLLHGAVVVGATTGASARISGTPIMESGSWTAGDALGKLALTNVSGTFQNGENLLVNGVIRARVSGAIGAKTNYIRVYYGDVNSHGTQNDIPTDSANRGGNLRIVTGSNNVIHWPVDNVSDWSAYYDYMTLVRWADQTGTGATRLGGSGTKEANAIIQDSSLRTPDNGAIDRSGIALHATGDSATSTYFDDFAIQY